MAKVKSPKPCQPEGRGEGRRTLPQLSPSLCQNHSHVPFFNHSFVCQCWIEFAHLSRRVKGAAGWGGAVFGLLPFCATSAAGSAHLPTSSEWHHFQDCLLQGGLMHQTCTHIYTHTRIMKTRIMEKHFIPKRYSWVSLFYSFGHFSTTFASNALMLGGCTLSATPQTSKLFPGFNHFYFNPPHSLVATRRRNGAAFWIAWIVFSQPLLVFLTGEMLECMFTRYFCIGSVWKPDASLICIEIQ